MSESPLLGQAWAITRSARWYQGNSRPGSPLAVRETAPIEIDGVSFRSVILEVGFPDGASEFYHVVLDTGNSSEIIHDDAGRRALVAALREPRDGFVATREVPAPTESRLFDGEQSNTSLFFGPYLLKVFRRLHPGPNLEVEVHQALRGTGLVAELFGTWRDGETDLGVFLEALHDPHDGFELAVRHARTGESFDEHAHALGSSLSHLHAALCAAFPTATASSAELRAACIQRLEQQSQEVPQLAAIKDQLAALYHHGEDFTFATQRIHGDCHLGQVLLSQGRWRWVDFEGEPLKTMEQRRTPDSPMRDVAGILRSFSYAAAQATDPMWEAHCRTAFLDGYGPISAHHQWLLEVYEIDKAIYEVVYEARSRPGWVHIPLNSLNNRIAHDKGVHHGA